MPKLTQDQPLARNRQAEILVGTSGWHYKHWKGDFYPSASSPKEMLPLYAREFSTVEVNNSFYRLPEKDTFRKWKSQVPSGFVFAVKASRFITHMKRLRDPKPSIDLLLQRATSLGKSLGPILFQLPPRWKLDIDRLRGFLAVLPQSLQVAIEFRDLSWCVDKVYSMLEERNVALCIHDWQSTPWPHRLTADFTYIRFHGYRERYGGDYPEIELQKWAERILAWKPYAKQVYAYFNNDARGYAVSNARFLRRLLVTAAGHAGESLAA